MKVFGLGAPEFFVILLMAVLLFGWKIFPKLGTSIGRFFGSIKHEVGNDGQWDDPAPSTGSTAETTSTPLLAPAPASACATAAASVIPSEDSATVAR